MNTSTKKAINKSDSTCRTITRKDLLNHFLLFRFLGSIGLFLVFAIIATIFDNSDRHSDLLVSLGVVTGINIPIQLWYLITALIKYLTENRKIK